MIDELTLDVVNARRLNGAINIADSMDAMMPAAAVFTDNAGKLTAAAALPARLGGMGADLSAPTHGTAQVVAMRDSAAELLWPASQFSIADSFAVRDSDGAIRASVLSCEDTSGANSTLFSMNTAASTPTTVISGAPVEFTTAVSVPAPTSGNHAARLSDVTTIAVRAAIWKKPVAAFVAAPLSTPSVGDRYVCSSVSSQTPATWAANNIYEWNGAAWDEFVPDVGWCLLVRGGDIFAGESVIFLSGGEWSSFGMSLNHDDLMNRGAYAHSAIDEHINSTATDPHAGQDLRATAAPTFAGANISGTLAATTIAGTSAPLSVATAARFDGGIVAPIVLTGATVPATTATLDTAADGGLEITAASVRLLPNVGIGRAANATDSLVTSGTILVGGTSRLTGAASSLSINTPVAVSGVISSTSAITAPSATIAALDATTLNATGATTIGGRLSAMDEIDVASTATFRSGVSVAGALIATGNSSMANLTASAFSAPTVDATNITAATVAATSISASDIAATSTLTSPAITSSGDISAATTVLAPHIIATADSSLAAASATSLAVSGATTLSGALTTNGATMAGTTNVTGALHVANNATFASKITAADIVAPTATIGTLAVTDSMTVENVTVTNYFATDGTLNAHGKIIADGNISTAGTLHSDGAATFGANVTVSGSLHVVGAAAVDADLSAANVSTATLTTTAANVSGALSASTASVAGVITAGPGALSATPTYSAPGVTITSVDSPSVLSRTLGAVGNSVASVTQNTSAVAGASADIIASNGTDTMRIGVLGPNTSSASITAAYVASNKPTTISAPAVNINTNGATRVIVSDSGMEITPTTSSASVATGALVVRGDIGANHATFGALDVNAAATVGSLAAGVLTANSAALATATATTLTATNADVTGALSAASANIPSLTSAAADITTATIANLSVSNLSAPTTSFANLTATSAEIGTLSITGATTISNASLTFLDSGGVIGTSVDSALISSDTMLANFGSFENSLTVGARHVVTKPTDAFATTGRFVKSVSSASVDCDSKLSSIDAAVGAGAQVGNSLRLLERPDGGGRIDVAGASGTSATLDIVAADEIDITAAKTKITAPLITLAATQTNATGNASIAGNLHVGADAIFDASAAIGGGLTVTGLTAAGNISAANVDVASLSVNGVTRINPAGDAGFVSLAAESVAIAGDAEISGSVAAASASFSGAISAGGALTAASATADHIIANVDVVAESITAGTITSTTAASLSSLSVSGESAFSGAVTAQNVSCAGISATGTVAANTVSAGVLRGNSLVVADSYGIANDGVATFSAVNVSGAISSDGAISAGAQITAPSATVSGTLTAQTVAAADVSATVAVNAPSVATGGTERISAAGAGKFTSVASSGAISSSSDISALGSVSAPNISATTSISAPAVNVGSVGLTDNSGTLVVANPVSGAEFYSNAPISAANQLVTKSYVDGYVSTGMSWITPVIDFMTPSASVPIPAAVGDRYISTVTYGEYVANYIYQATALSPLTWHAIAPVEGNACIILRDAATANESWIYNGATDGWQRFGMSIPFSSLEDGPNNSGANLSTTGTPTFAGANVTSMATIGRAVITSAADANSGSPALAVAGGVTCGGASTIGGDTLISSTTQSSSTTTGALVVSGGIAATKNANFGGDVTCQNLHTASVAATGAASAASVTTAALAVSGTTASTSPATGAETIAGGLGVGLEIHAGQGIYAGADSAVTGNLGVSETLTTKNLTVTGSAALGASITLDNVSIGTCAVSGVLSSTNTTTATAIGTGAIHTAGGLSAAGAIYGASLNATGAVVSGGDVTAAGKLYVNDATDSTAAGTGAAIITGGISAAKTIRSQGALVGAALNSRCAASATADIISASNSSGTEVFGVSYDGARISAGAVSGAGVAQPTALAFTPSTASNTAGADVTIKASNGTGSAASGAIIFQTAKAAAAGAAILSTTQLPDSGNTNLATWSVNCGSAANRVLVVFVSCGYNVGINSATYAGTAMTLAGTIVNASNSSAIYYLALGATTGANNLAVVPAGWTNMGGIAVVVSGADQTAPVGAMVSTSSQYGTGGSLVASSAIGDQVIDFLSAGANVTPAFGSGQTQLASFAFYNNLLVAASAKTSVGTSTTVSATFSSANWSYAVMAVKAVAGTGGASLTNALTIAPAAVTCARPLIVTDSTESTSVGTGAAIVAGGAAVGGNTNVGGAVAITGAASVGGNLTVAGATTFTGGISTASAATTAISAPNGGLSVGLDAAVGGALTAAGAIKSTSATASTSTATGAIVATAGGLGIGGAANIGGTTTIGGAGAGALSVPNGGAAIGGALSVGGNAAVSGNATVAGNFGTAGIMQVNNSSAVCATFDGGISVTKTIANTGGISTSGVLSVTNTTPASGGNAALIVSGGTQIALGVVMGGNLSANGAVYAGGGFSTTSSTASTSTTTGAAVISNGGLGVGGAVNVGGAITAAGAIKSTNATESTSTTTGSAVFSGGIAAAKNANVGGSLAVTLDTIVGGTLAVGGPSLLHQMECTGATFNGAVNIPGNSLSCRDINASTSIVCEGTVNSNGAFLSNISSNLHGTTTMSGSTIVTYQAESLTPTTGAFVVSGGVGIGGNIHVGGGMYSTGEIVGSGAIKSLATTASTDTTTGCAVFSGGVGIAGAENVGGALTAAGIVTANSATASTTTTTGALVIPNGGLGVAGAANIGGAAAIAGNVSCTATTSSTSSTTGAVTIGGGLGVAADEFVGGAITAGGIIKTTATTASTTTTTGAILSGGGIGAVGAITAGGAIKTTATTASTSTTTGSGIFAGGLGVAGAAFIGGAATVTGILTAPAFRSTVLSVAVNGTATLTGSSPERVVVGLSGTTGTATITLPSASNASMRFRISSVSTQGVVIIKNSAAVTIATLNGPTEVLVSSYSTGTAWTVGHLAAGTVTISANVTGPITTTTNITYSRSGFNVFARVAGFSFTAASSASSMRIEPAYTLGFVPSVSTGGVLGQVYAEIGTAGAFTVYSNLAGAGFSAGVGYQLYTSVFSFISATL